MSETEWESDPSFNYEPSKHSHEDIRVAIQAYQLCRSKLKILDTLPIFYVYILWLADAYMAHLDEQAALQQPYDFEWLVELPQCERDFDDGTLLFQTRYPDTCICCDETIKERRLVWWISREGERNLPIPVPATKADVLKLLEVFK